MSHGETPLKDQIDSITMENRNYKNHSAIIDLSEEINTKIENVMEMLNKFRPEILKEKNKEQNQDRKEKTLRT